MSDIFVTLREALGDRYTIGRELGRGGMATVYLARDRKHDRDVALKVLDSDIALSLGVGRFLREIRTTARLTHPHILPLHDSGEVEGILYYSMPYVAGESLRDRLQRDKQLSVDEAVSITCDVASALDYAHRHGNFSDPFGLCPDPNDTWCVAFESGMTILGGAAGLLIGGVVGGAEIVGTGGIATPAAIATVATTTVGGLMIGKAAGQAISNVLFADRARPKDGSEQRDDIEKEQAGRQKQGRGESLRSIEKSKQRGKVSDKQKAQDALDEIHKNVEP